MWRRVHRKRQINFNQRLICVDLIVDWPCFIHFETSCCSPLLAKCLKTRANSRFLAKNSKWLFSSPTCVQAWLSSDECERVNQQRKTRGSLGGIKFQQIIIVDILNIQISIHQLSNLFESVVGGVDERPEWWNVWLHIHTVYHSC